MAQGSYFKGWASNLPNIPQSPSLRTTKELYIGHVLNVDYKSYDIKVRVVGKQNEKEDDEITTTAKPIDLNMVKLPLPGEVVLLVQGIENLTAKNKFAYRFYYIRTVTINNNLTYNSEPYIGRSVSPAYADILYDFHYQHRFENKLKSLDSFIINDPAALVNTNPQLDVIPTVYVKDKPKLKPSEGDVILQSRFGSAIRLGSTSYNPNGSQTPWSIDGGIYGDPIVVLSNDRTTVQGVGGLTLESVNELESAVYVCSSQTLDIKLMTSKLLSFKSRYDMPVKDGEFSKDNVDPVSFVESPEEIAKPWTRPAEGGLGGGSATAVATGQGSTIIPSAPPRIEGTTNTRYDLPDNIVISVPKQQNPDYPLFIVFGGIDYATSRWMYEQMNGAMLSKYVVVVANYTKRVDSIKQVYESFFAKNKITITSTSVAGFSAGGYAAQDAYSPVYKVFGLIDPSTKESYASLPFNNNAVMLYNPNNWGSYETIQKAQPIIAAKIIAGGGAVESLKMSHAVFPKYFFNKYAV